MGLSRAERYWLVAAVFIAGWILVALFSHGPKRKLPDGSILRLERVAFEKSAKIEQSGALQRLKAKLPKAWTDRFPSPYIRGVTWSSGFVVNTNQDALFNYFSRRDPASGNNLSVDVRNVEILDEHGCVFVPSQIGGGDDGRPMEEPDGPSGSRQNYSVGWFRFDAFPRHEKQFRLRVYDGAKVATEFKIDNPAFRKSPPPTNWMVESLPITKKQGNVAITLAQVKTKASPEWDGRTDRVPREISQFYSFAENGQPSTNWQVLDTELYDSSGNHYPEGVTGQSYLCPYEKAWKLCARFVGSEKSLSASNTAWTLHGISVPEAGKVTSLGVARNLRSVWVRAIAFAGPGRFDYAPPGNIVESNDVPIKSSAMTPAEAGEGQEVKIQGKNNSWGKREYYFSVKFNAPHLMLEVNGTNNDERMTVRATDEQGRDYYAYKWDERRRSPGVHYLFNDWNNAPRSFLVFDFPPDVKKVGLTFCVHAVQAADFIFKPPLVEMSKPDGNVPSQASAKQ